MVPVALAERLSVARHHPLGASTGYLAEHRGDWASLAEEAAEVSPFAVELAALSEPELPGLLAYLAGGPELPFRYLSVHAPTKDRRMPERELVARLAALPAWVDAIVVHPDAMADPAAYRALGSRLVVENMDPRKPTGRTAEELEPVMWALPEAGFCFDIAHAAAVDPTLREGERLLDRFAPRLRHLHVSALDAEGHHVELSAADDARFAWLLRRCQDVPWILEAPLPAL